MPRVLLIDPDRDGLAALQKALGDAGLTNVAAVPSASFALTMLERDRPDLIVSRAGVPDIDGYELCSIVRSDPSMAGVLFLLLAEPGDAGPTGGIEGAPDRTLVGELTAATIVSEVMNLLGHDQPADVPGPATPDAEPAHGLHGSLGVMDLPDLTQAIALGNKTGILALVLGSGEGVVVFGHGRIVHAEFGRLVGEPAFAALVIAAHKEGRGSFTFNAVEVLAPNVPKTIQRSVKQLLLSTAAEIDEGQAGPAAIVPIK
ncbi:MAG TPA: DUF4388 domain-containing protein [Methylomirabilota bacterium]|jgi:CheY-like chemotaxis protein|nr:DUF4388 domain-containing protein [Methylomirabilota bacterium]